MGTGGSKNQKAEAEAEVLRSFERIITHGDGDVGVRIRRSGNKILLFTYCSVRRQISKAEVTSEFLAALASVLNRRPFGFVTLELEGDQIYLCFSILKRYEMPAADAAEIMDPRGESQRRSLASEVITAAG